jgi:hypothetical protein
MLKYRVDGIPHFLFLDQKGEHVAESVGDTPIQIMSSNLTALIMGSTLPYAQASGKASKFSASISPVNQDDPRSHGQQVVN